jgi:uncharacterized protein YcbK (DUF882 family)
VKVDEKLIQGLQKLRDRLGRPIHVTSGFRCQKKNDSLPGAAKNSLHLTGQAADIACDMPLLMLYFEAIAVPEFREGGCGLYEDGNFVHVDVRGKRARWGRVDGKYTTITQALDALKARRKKDDTLPDSPSA